MLCEMERGIRSWEDSDRIDMMRRSMLSVAKRTEKYTSIVVPSA